MAIAASLQLLRVHFDKIILIKLLPLEAFGYYVLASTVASGLSFLETPIYTAVFPRLSQHVLHEEWYSVSEETARLINERRGAGARVWAVGTTSIRTLESGCRYIGCVISM